MFKGDGVDKSSIEQAMKGIDLAYDLAQHILFAYHSPKCGNSLLVSVYLRTLCALMNGA